MAPRWKLSRWSLKKQLDDASNESFRNNLEREVVRKVDPPVPDAMVDRYLDNLVETLSRLSTRPMDMNRVREENREGARNKVKWYLVKEHIIKSENLSVPDEEIDSYLKKFAEENGADYERLRI